MRETWVSGAIPGRTTTTPQANSKRARVAVSLRPSGVSPAKSAGMTRIVPGSASAARGDAIHRFAHLHVDDQASELGGFDADERGHFARRERRVPREEAVKGDAEGPREDPPGLQRSARITLVLKGNEDAAPRAYALEILGRDHHVLRFDHRVTSDHGSYPSLASRVT